MEVKTITVKTKNTVPLNPQITSMLSWMEVLSVCFHLKTLLFSDIHAAGVNRVEEELVSCFPLSNKSRASRIVLILGNSLFHVTSYKFIKFL